MHATSGVFAHQKALHHFFCAWTAVVVVIVVNMRPPKYLMGPNSFDIFVWFMTYVSALIVFVVTLSSIQYYCCIVAIYDVRSSHTVSIRTGLKPRLICHDSYHFNKQQQPIRVKWKETSYYIYTCSRISVHYYDTSYDTCRGTNVWPLIGSKFAKNGWKLDKVDKPGVSGLFKPKTGTMWGWPIAGLLACNLFLVLECTCFWHRSDQVYLFLAKSLIFMFVLFRFFILLFALCTACRIASRGGYTMATR